MTRPVVLGKSWRPALAVVVAVAAVFLVDRWVGSIDQGGPYRQAIREPVSRAQRAHGAEHIVLGCSTSEWFPSAIRGYRKLSSEKVVDAHMSDCHQSCTMAEATALRRLGLHYQTATFGVNMFEYCEKYRARRSMQEVALLPFDESLRLLPIYAASDDPLRLAGGWLLNHLSLVYGNTMWLQRHHRKAWFGNESLSSTWFRKSKPKKQARREAFECDYLEADRRFGLAATRAAVEAATELADQVYLVVLPEKPYSGDAPAAARAREKFFAEHADLTKDLDGVHVIDLLDSSLAQARHFRDNAHLNRQGIKAASKLFRQKLSTADSSAAQR